MYAACSSNPDLDDPFRQLYSGIERANLCIKYIPTSTVYQNGSQSDKDMMDRYLGEALTLRAQFYYELIRNWGDVPFQNKPASDYDNLFLAKTDRDVIVCIREHAIPFQMSDTMAGPREQTYPTNRVAFPTSCSRTVDAALQTVLHTSRECLQNR